MLRGLPAAPQRARRSPAARPAAHASQAPSRLIRERPLCRARVERSRSCCSRRAWGWDSTGLVPVLLTVDGAVAGHAHPGPNRLRRAPGEVLALDGLAGEVMAVSYWAVTLRNHGSDPDRLRIMTSSRSGLSIPGYTITIASGGLLKGKSRSRSRESVNAAVAGVVR